MAASVGLSVTAVSPFNISVSSGNAINAVLAAAGYNFRRLLAWLRLLLLRTLIAFSLTSQLKSV